MVSDPMVPISVVLWHAIRIANLSVPTLRIDLPVLGLKRFDRNCFGLLTQRFGADGRTERR